MGTGAITFRFTSGGVDPTFRAAVERALGELRHRYPVVILDRAGRRLPATNAEQTAALHWARGEFGGIPN